MRLNAQDKPHSFIPGRENPITVLEHGSHLGEFTLNLLDLKALGRGPSELGSGSSGVDFVAHLASRSIPRFPSRHELLLSKGRVGVLILPGAEKRALL